MNQEPPTVTYSLEEILREIKQDIREVNQKLEKVDVDLTEIKTEIKGINKRLDSQEFINRSVVVGLLVTIGAGAIKLFFPRF